MNGTEELLQRLGANDEPSLNAVLAGVSDSGALDLRTRMLVLLSALLVADACTASLRWAVDSASAIGLDDELLVQVLITAASAAGSAQLVSCARRLALALDVDIETAVEAEPLLPEKPSLHGLGDRL